MDDPYVKYWNELEESGEFEWADEEEEELKAFCQKCGFLTLAHKGDRCPTEAEAEAYVLGGIMCDDD